MSVPFFINTFLIAVSCCKLCAAVQCMDENNEAIDWFVVYKIPKKEHTNKLIAEGVGYTYITSADYSKWSLSLNAISDNASIVANTLRPLYNSKNTISYVLYNDQPPNGPSKPSKGHTKGVILANSNGGFWLVHSVPHFPPEDHYMFPSSGVVKGQSFLCISTDLKNLDKVGIQLQYNQPQVYAAAIENSIQTNITQIAKAAADITVSEPPWYNAGLIISRTGTPFTSFAKSGKFGKDLYVDWVAPALETDLMVESWLNGEGRLPSDCSKPFKVYNVKNVSINVANTTFTSTEDHSKWTVSTNLSWICVGDINRMAHQKQRGGGTVCLNNKNLTEDYREAILSIEKCEN